MLCLRGLALVLKLMLPLSMQSAAAEALRAPRVAVETMVPVEIAAVTVDPLGGQPVVLLRDAEHGGLVIISIGVAEARAIALALEGVPVPRPQTHDLLANLFGALQAELLRVLVDDLSDGTYFGLLEVQPAGDGPVLFVDARPSDALALAVRMGVPVLAAPSVLDSGREPLIDGLPAGTTVTALGVTVGEASAELRRALQLPDTPGVVVSRASGIAAERGLPSGALLLSVNGVAVASPADYLEQAGRIAANESARLRFWHRGREREIEVPGDLPRQRRAGPPIAV